MRFRLVVDGDPHEVEVTPAERGHLVKVDGVSYRATARRTPKAAVVRLGRRSIWIRLLGDRAVVAGSPHRIEIPEILDADVEASRRVAAVPVRIAEVRPPMPGRIVRILVEEGSHVSKGQTLLVLEAMKMQNEIPAPEDAIVREVRVAEGESVTGDRVVVALEIR
jgi:glutaconyl-CoA decarboxylase